MERWQNRAGLQHWEGRQREQDLLSLMALGNPMAAHLQLWGAERTEEPGCLQRERREETELTRDVLDGAKEILFLGDNVQKWTRGPTEAIGSPSLEDFRTHLDS